KINVITPLCLVMKQTLTINLLATSNRSPKSLLFRLIRHPSKHVSTHKIVIQERLVTILVVLDELICQRIDEQSADRNIPLMLPGSHHPSESDEIAIAKVIAFTYRQNLRSGIGGFPRATAVSIGECVAIVFVGEAR